MSDDTRLDELLSRWEEGRRGGRAVTPEELCAGTPELTDELRRRVRALEAIEPWLASATPTDAGTEPQRAGLPDVIETHSRYRVVRSHARGGLGEVLLARDEGLGREVALKVIQAPRDRDARSRRRFVREAEITGRLEHPGVVPVYGAGQDAAGRPCYAMRLIRGETLGEAIQRFHGASRDGDGLAFRQLLGRFVGVCNTIAYAHSAGVVHRDLKPANIMLGPFGETLVVDWGLAKSTGEAGDDETGPLADRGGQTETGAIFGTPAFMSPQQAAGQSKAATPADDIYSLGATLYALLTGKAPIQPGGNAGEVLERVRRGDFPPPRQVRPAVPAALEAICLKAMAARSEDRYPDALALVADVEHWLADEPVSAYPDPWRVRLRRWARRHRTVVSSALAGGFVAILVLGVAVVMLNQAKAREQRQKELANESFTQARQAVDTYFARVSQSKLGNAPGTQSIRRELLEVALQYYQEFLRQRGDDPALAGEAADAYRKIARVQRETGALPQALAAHEAGIALRRRLHREAPDDRNRAHALAEHLKDYGTDLRRVPRYDDGLRALDEAVEILDEVLLSAPDDDKAEELLSKVCLNRGVLLGDTNRLAEAQAATRRGLELLERRGRRHPDDRLIRIDTAIAYLNMGVDLGVRKHDEEAIATLRQARDLAAEIVRRDREDKNPDLMRVNEGVDLLARANYNLGWRLHQVAQLDPAADSLEVARAGWAVLARDNPAVIEHRYMQGLATTTLAYTRLKQGRPEEALRLYTESRGLAERLRRDENDSARSISAVGLTWDGEGAVLTRMGRRDEAVRAFDRAMPFHEQAAAKAPGVLDYSFCLNQHFELLGRARRDWGDAAGAIEAACQRRAAAAPLPPQLYEAAADFALCLPLVKSTVEKEELAREAVQTLRQALAAGFTDVAKVKSDAVLAPLRERPDFRAVVAEFEAAAKKP